MSSKSSAKNTPSSGKNLKQGTLFSFFSKKPESTDKPPAKVDPKRPAASVVSTPTPSKASSVTPSTEASNATSASTNVAIQQEWERVSVGMRIAVFWKDDGKYYEAKVTGQKNKNLRSEFLLQYDDGDTERIDLATEKFRFLEEDDPPKSADAFKTRTRTKSLNFTKTTRRRTTTQKSRSGPTIMKSKTTGW